MIILNSINPPFKKFIKNHDKPLCKNCKFYRTVNNKCTKFGNTNLISGSINYEYAYYCRTDKTKCGIDAIFYEENLISDYYSYNNDLINNKNKTIFNKHYTNDLFVNLDENIE